jgi:hypothetical protein
MLTIDVADARFRSTNRPAVKTALFVILVSVFGCSPTEPQIAGEHGQPSLNLVALHSEGIAPNTQLDSTQKATIGGLCGDTGADISIRLHEFFLRDRIFSFLVCSILAFVCGWLAALIFWKGLAPSRRVGWSWFFLCILGAWVVAGVAACLIHRYYVQQPLARAIASHRTLLQLAQETWIPRSTNESIQDFSANCSDRLEDIASGAQYGDKALSRYPTIFRSEEELPSKDTNPSLYWAVIRARAKDMAELFAVDSGFGKTQRVAASWSEVIDTNSRFRLITDRDFVGIGWFVHSDWHPAAVLILLIGTVLFAWGFLKGFSNKIRKLTKKEMEQVA